MLVCGKNSFDKLSIWENLQVSDIEWIRFSDYTSNPKYEEIINGVKVFRGHQCEMIVAIGGGSAIDVAKCIRHFANMDISCNCLAQEYVGKSNIKLVACPTTAGTGSESTHFATLYKDDEKYSVSHEDVFPEYVILDASFLSSVPEYHKKSAYMDALCHAIESWWSKQANDASIEYSKKAIKLLLENRVSYFAGDPKASEKILEAANYAGKAINITTTTAAHAMSYKLTSMCGISHGHAVALCLVEVMKHNIKFLPGNTVISRDIPTALGVNSGGDSICLIRKLLKEFEFNKISVNNEDVKTLTNSVNVERLSNNPCEIKKEEIERMYESINNNNGCKQGTTYWVTGLSGAGKTTIGTLLYKEIKKEKDNVVLLDGDILRQVYQTTDYSAEGRIAITYQNSRLCKTLNDQGIDVVICVIAMYDECRKWNRENIENYKEIYLEVPIDVLIKRDSKGLYAKALKKEISNVYGIDLPFEEPKSPDIKIVNDGVKSKQEVLKEIFSMIK